MILDNCRTTEQNRWVSDSYFILDGTCELNFRGTAAHAIGYDSRPYHVAVGDFNRDGHLDMVVANSGTDSVGILLGYGNGSFLRQITCETGVGSRPYAVAVGDFNNDIKLDIVVANFGTNSVGVLAGDGQSNFANPKMTALGPSRPLSLATGDFNQDKKLDIAVANYGTLDITILLGSNDGFFRIKASYQMGYDSVPYSIIVADLNNDKRLDIATVNYETNNLAILLANKNGAFTVRKYSTMHGSFPCSLAIGDFNSDNQLDIAVANTGTSSIGVFLGRGNGTFASMTTYTTGVNSRPKDIVVKDFTNDTKLDIAVLDSGDDYVIILQGDGNGNFTVVTRRSNAFYSDPSSMTSGDFDDDTIPDIAITNNGTNNVQVLIAYTAFPVANQVTYSTGEHSEATSIDVGDLNNDQHMDIVVANMKGNSVGVFLNLGDGTFGNQTEYSTGEDSTPYFVVIADMNNDNQRDIVVVMIEISAVLILIGHRNGSFSYGNSYSTGEEAYPEAITVADLNNDMNLDIIVANSEVGVGVLLGYGNGSFTNITTYLNGFKFYPRYVTFGDLNQDERLDIVATDYDNDGIAILLGDGNGSFDKQFILPIDDRPNCLVIGNLNNDEYVDMVYVSAYYNNLAILLGQGNVTFGDVNRYPTGLGSWPWYVVLGHFNDDTLLDIAISTTYGFYAGIFFGFGNGSFAAVKEFPTGYNSYPSSIACGDFNNDHQLDIVVTNQNANNIGVFLLHYQMDFTHQSNYFTGSGSHPYSVTIGTFNRENQSAIVVANSGNDNIQLLRVDNRGILISKVTYSTGFYSYPEFVTIGDFNRDNQLDIIVANNRNDSIKVFAGHSNGTLDTPTIHWTGTASFPISIAIGDFNEDNWTDIVVANNGTDNIGVFLGFNYATFTNETIVISGPSSSPMHIATNDFNNDGHYDLAIVSDTLSMIRLYLGYGNGSFAEQRPIWTGVYASFFITSSDLNGDHQLDLVVINEQNNIGVLLGHGNGSFASQKTYSTGKDSSPKWLAIGDLNNDSVPDIVVVNRGIGKVGVFIGYGNGTFPKQRSYAIPNQSKITHLVLNDLNHDKILDIIVTNFVRNSLGIFLGYGNGTFRKMKTLSTGNKSGPYSVATADIDNDTNIDIVVAYREGDIGILFGYGNVTFSTQTIYSTGSESDLAAITIADLNNDNKLDIAVSNFGHGDGRLDVFYGYGDGTFAARKIYSTGWDSDPISMAVADFNHDNQLDLVIVYRNQDTIGIMLREKTEPFTAPAFFSTGNDSHPISVTVGDFNHDTQQDIVVANSGTNNIGIFIGYENGTFAPQRVYSIGNNSEPISIAVGDFNHDHHLDVAVADFETDTIVILRGHGDGTFTILASYFTGIRSAPSSIAVADLDRDNYLDIVVSNFGSSDLLIFLGSHDGTLIQGRSYSLGYNARPRSVAIGDINQDTLLDIVVANYGGDYVETFIQTC